jgi:hypothetical protein
VPTTVKVSLYSLAVLLNNVVIASKHPRLGILDANRTLETLIDAMNKDVLIDTEVLESSLCHANLLDELDRFYHPQDTTFDTMLARTLPPGLKFDKKVNIIRIRGDRNA